MTYQARTGDRLGILKFTCKTRGHYFLKTHNYSYRGSQIVKKMRFKTLLMNQGIRFLMAFVSAAVPCVCPYFSLRQCHLLIAAVLKLFSNPPPPSQHSYIHLQRASSRNYFGHPDCSFTRCCQVRMYTGGHVHRDWQGGGRLFTICGERGGG